MVSYIVDLSVIVFSNDLGILCLYKRHKDLQRYRYKTQVRYKSSDSSSNLSMYFRKFLNLARTCSLIPNWGIFLFY
jgi:hypothetical protein